MVALARQPEDLVVRVLEQVLDVLALEERGVRQHHRRVGVRLERPAQHGVVLQRFLRQLAAREIEQQLRAEIAVLGPVGVGDQVPRQLARGILRNLELGDAAHRFLLVRLFYAYPAIEQCAFLFGHGGEVARRHGARQHRLLVDQQPLRLDALGRIELHSLRRLGEPREARLFGVAAQAAQRRAPASPRGSSPACAAGSAAAARASPSPRRPESARAPASTPAPFPCAARRTTGAPARRRAPWRPAPASSTSGRRSSRGGRRSW